LSETESRARLIFSGVSGRWERGFKATAGF